MPEIIQPKIQLLLQVVIDSNNKLQLSSPLPKKELTNLLIQLLGMIVNQEEKKIITS